MILSEEMIAVYRETTGRRLTAFFWSWPGYRRPPIMRRGGLNSVQTGLRLQGARDVYIDQALNVVYPADVRQDRPVEVFMAHMDVVFSDESELPLRVEDGRIYCPGVGDDTACLVCLLLAGRRIAEHVDSPSGGKSAGRMPPDFCWCAMQGKKGWET